MATNTPSSDTPPVTAAVLSTDADFQLACRRILEDPSVPVELGLVLDRPFTDIGDIDLEELRRADPGLVIVDLESDPHVGMLFIQFLVESRETSAVVAAGRELSQELLLQAIQAGVTEVLTKPLEPEPVREAFRRVLRKTGRLAKKEERRSEPGHAIALFGAKGGVGTTVLATNLAVAIHRLTRQRTLLLDLDVELGDTAFLLGIEPKFSLLDLLRNFHRVDSGLLASFVQHHESGIEVLAAPAQPADFDTVNGDRLREALDLLREHYEWIVIDKPKGFHSAFHCVLEEATETYLVTTPDIAALRCITRSLPLLEKLRGSRQKTPIRLLANRCEPNQVVSLKDIERTVGLEVFHSLRNDFAPIIESINEGTPVVLRGSSKFAGDVRKLAAAMTEVSMGEAPRKSPLQGLVGALRPRRPRTV